MLMDHRLFWAFARIGAMGYMMGYKFAACFLLAYYAIQWMLSGANDWE